MELLLFFLGKSFGIVIACVVFHSRVRTLTDVHLISSYMSNNRSAIQRKNDKVLRLANEIRKSGAISTKHIDSETVELKIKVLV